MLDLQWQREGGTEGERLRITSWKKTSSGKRFEGFF